MKYLPPGYNTKDLEAGVKNKWRWQWLTEIGEEGEKWGQWLKKPDIAGIAFCEVCGRTLSYKSSGKKTFKFHAAEPQHKKNMRIIKENQVLPGSSKATEMTESIQNRVAKQRAITAAFLSEHCLPFSLAPELLDYAKRLAEDKQALDKTTISKTSATYINTHGVAKDFRNEIKDKLKGKMFSLNVDEATNNNNDKILNVIAQYYDEESGQVELTHFGSRKQNLASASNIMESLEDILSDYDIGWGQVISVLMDNCSTMRGKKGGVEALIRQKNPNLLDISGDTVHMVNNVAKTLLSCVDSDIPLFASDVFYDIEESPKVQEIFSEIQSLMNIMVPKHLIRPISSRFLQMLDVTTRLIECVDSLTVYYYGFLTEDEKRKHRTMISQIFQEHAVSDEAQAAINLLQLSQEKQQKSVTSNERKDRILDLLFQHRRETTTKINLFRGLLSTFQGFVKSFQSEKPLIHTLHRRIVDLTSEVLGMFIKAEHIPDSVTALTKLDVTDKTLQKPDKDLSVGAYAYTDLSKARMDKSCKHWVSALYSDLRSGYTKAAQKMLKMPLDNKTIRRLSVLDPGMAYYSQTSLVMKKLAKGLPNMFTGEEMGHLAVETDKYSVDRDIKEIGRNFNQDDRIDNGYWTKVFGLKSFDKERFPFLKKLVASLLTVFSGPLIESTFNIMDDIVEKDRTKLTVKNYEAVAIVKTALKRKKVRSVKLKVTNSMAKSCIYAYASYQGYLKEKKEHEEAKRREQLDKSVNLLKAKRAKQLANLMRRTQKNINQKRKSIDSATGGSERGRWKRIKLI